MITIPCKYQAANSKPCNNGKLFIYGEMGGQGPETIDCPKCHGLGTIKVSRDYIIDCLESLENIKREIDQEIIEFQGYLTSQCNWDILKNGKK